MPVLHGHEAPGVLEGLAISVARVAHGRELAGELVWVEHEPIIGALASRRKLIGLTERSLQGGGRGDRSRPLGAQAHDPRAPIGVALGDRVQAPPQREDGPDEGVLGEVAHVDGPEEVTGR